MAQNKTPSWYRLHLGTLYMHRNETKILVEADLYLESLSQREVYPARY